MPVILYFCQAGKMFPEVFLLMNTYGEPNHGLTDSTSLAFWAKPANFVAYYLTLTDSAGCVATGAPVYHVNVLPVSVVKMKIL
jgi:hypothetical protein